MTTEKVDWNDFSSDTPSCDEDIEESSREMFKKYQNVIITLVKINKNTKKNDIEKLFKKCQFKSIKIYKNDEAEKCVDLYIDYKKDLEEVLKGKGTYLRKEIIHLTLDEDYNHKKLKKYEKRQKKK